MGVDRMMPVTRFHDAQIYAREWSGGGLLMGGFESNAISCFYKDGIPDKFEFQLLEENWEQFSKNFFYFIHLYLIFLKRNVSKCIKISDRNILDVYFLAYSYVSDIHCIRFYSSLQAS